MNEVSCRALGLFFDGLTQRGIPHDQLVEGMPVTLDRLRGFQRRIDWDLFVDLCERVETLCGGREELFELGREQFRGSATFSFMRQVARVFRRPRDIYWMGTVWFGRSLFSILEDEFKDLPDRRIREVIRIPPAYRDCPQLFHLMHGALTAAPRILRYPDAHVEMSLGPREATYLITPPAREKFSLREIASLTSRFAAWDLIDAMGKQQDELKENVQELDAARAEAAQQIRHLQEIGKLLCHPVGLEELSRELAGVFEKHLPDWRATLWIQPLDGGEEIQLLEAKGVSGPPACDYRLETGKGSVGRLEVWNPSERADRLELLEALVPWMALALDGARSYAVVREAAIGPFS